MLYLVRMNLVDSARPSTADDGVNFIEEYILPTLDLCKKLQEQKRIVAGGPVSGAVALVLLVSAESPRELDDLLTSLPVWSRMQTEVTPLTTFDARAQSLRPRLDQLKGQARVTRMPARGGSR